MIRPLRTENNLAKLRVFAETLKGRRVMVEVGTYIGEGACLFAPMVDHLICVDTWDRDGREAFDTWTDRTSHLSNVSYLHMPSIAAAALIKCADVVYIDAAHDYDSVKADIIAWLPVVSAGGILSGHDYGPHAPGVIQAVDEMIGKPSQVYGETTWRR